ncbi:MAG: acyl-CoA desaturase [Myxococcota bacterium]
MSSPTSTRAPDEKIELLASVPFFAVHAMCLFAFYTGVTWQLVGACLASYYLRMLAVTIGYHRYFAHRTFKTNRAFQLLLALLASTSAQKGVLWWAAHHRHHHRESDQAGDVHSPTLKGFWWSHAGWILCRKYNPTRFDLIKDFARFPELVWLNRWHLLPPTALGVATFFIGGFPLLIWGFFIPTVLLWHGTFTINSLSHVFGSRRYRTTDTSRNNWLLALVTCGEGWHNNHHYHQNTANQGWFWWEVDLSFYLLKLLARVGLVSDLRLPPDAVRWAHLKYSPQERAALRAETGRFGLGQTASARVREAIAAAAERLPPTAPSPVPVLEQR